MNWTDNEVEAMWRDQPEFAPPPSVVRRIASRAVELVAARGGTMNADRLSARLAHAYRVAGPDAANELRAHMAAQGVRVATLEAEVERLTALYNPAEVERLRTARATVEFERDEARAQATALAAEANTHADARLAAEVERDELRTQVDAIGENFRKACRKADEQREAWEHEQEMRIATQKELSAMRQRAEAAEAKLQRMRDGIQAIVARCVDMAKVAGGPPRRLSLAKRPEEGRCAAPLAAGALCWSEPGHRGPHEATPTRYPCSPLCTHDDAATPGHHERVKERSAALKKNVSVHDITPAMEDVGDEMHVVQSGEEQEASGYADGRDDGMEAMRAACWEAIQGVMQKHGLSQGALFVDDLKAAIEGAAP